MKGKIKKEQIERIKVITLDGDGCLFSYDGKEINSKFHSSWDALGYAYGLSERWEKRTERFYGYKKEDDDWARLDVRDLKGRKVDEALKILYPIPYCKGAREFAEATKRIFYRGILSSAVDLVARKAYEELELNFVFCNVLNIKEGKFLGTHGHIVPLWKKAEKIEDICRMYNITRKEICHIGDNINDLSVGREVGLFIALNPKREEVKKAANFVACNFFEIMEVFEL
ncbi:MAG: HAD hydrolase family protein [Candidatus Pacearchaeota archaeon]|nr:HAD hydrolase family protein [Candidatus Pacearchaeota archaeon]